jgi:hypothetical protein
VFTRSFRERHDLSPTEYRARGNLAARETRPPVSISFDRATGDATLDRWSAGTS